MISALGYVSNISLISLYIADAKQPSSNSSIDLEKECSQRSLLSLVINAQNHINKTVTWKENSRETDSYRTDLNGGMELVRHIFTSTYKHKTQRKDDPMRRVNLNSLLMWNTQSFMNTYYDLRMNLLTHRAELRCKDVPDDTFRTLESEDQNSMTTHAQSSGLKSWDRDLHIKFHPFSRRDPVTWKLARPMLDDA